MNFGNMKINGRREKMTKLQKVRASVRVATLAARSTKISSVLLLDAMLLRGICHRHDIMCVCVRPSVTSQYCIETIGRIELVFGTQAAFHLSHPVF